MKNQAVKVNKKLRAILRQVGFEIDTSKAVGVFRFSRDSLGRYRFWAFFTVAVFMLSVQRSGFAFIYDKEAFDRINFTVFKNFSVFFAEKY